jgi:tetratricopeptide (TPR) repeat protein
MNCPYQNLPITSHSARAKEAIHAFAAELVSHGSNARVIFEAVDADPDCALAQACVAATFLTLLTREGQVQAAPRIVAAQALARFATPREQAFVEAIAAWGQGDDRRAVRILRAVVEDCPHDLVAAKFCQILELGVGDMTGMRRTSAMAASVDGRAGYALGLHAYALEQMGDPRMALRFGRRAIERNPGMDPWAQHAVAHALVAMEQPREARNFLRAQAPNWDRCSSFMLTHNWWHLALCEIELGNPEAALDLFDERVWGIRKGHAQDQINAISLLARLEMHGVRADWRWEDIASYVEDRVHDRISGFLDLHYLYALARSGRDAAADKLVEGVAGQTVVAALARGIVAHARSDHHGAATAIAPVVRHISEVGGSNIQRELFEALFFDSVMRTRTREVRCVAA